MKGQIIKEIARHLILSKLLDRAPVGEFLSRSYLVPLARYTIAKVSY
jgi:hypothetical protein